MTPEKSVQNRIMNYLKKLEDEGYPCYHERRQAGGFSYKKGIPDIYAVFNGIHIEIEVKRPGGELSSMQEKWRDKCKQRKIYWCCVDSLEDFKFYMHSIFPEFIF